MKTKLTILIFLFLASIPLSFGSVEREISFDEKVEILLDRVNVEDLEVIYNIAGEEGIELAFQKISDEAKVIDQGPRHPFPGGEGDEREPYPFE